MTNAEFKYTVTEWECLSVVHALRKWRYYLHGGPELIVETDHLSLKWLMSLKKPRGMLARWMVEVEEFQFVVKYMPESSMLVPYSSTGDAVDKRPCQRSFREIEATMDSVETAGAIVEGRQAASVAGGPFVGEMSLAQGGECRKELEIARKRGTGKFVISEQGIIHTEIRGRHRIVVPRSLLILVLGFSHGSRLCGNYGDRRTQERIAGRFWWRGWKGDVRSRVQECVAFVEFKANKLKRNAPMQVYHSPTSSRKLQSTFRQ